MGELTHEQEEAARAEDRLLHHTIPYQDRVLVKLRQAEPEVHESGIVEASTRTAMKYAKEALEGTVVRIGKRVTQVQEGDYVWLDKKTWSPSARYVIIREPDILAAQTPEG